MFLKLLFMLAMETVANNLLDIHKKKKLVLTLMLTEIVQPQVANVSQYATDLFKLIEPHNQSIH